MKCVELVCIGMASLLAGCGGAAAGRPAEPLASAKIRTTHVALAPSRDIAAVPKPNIDAHRDSLRKAVHAAEKRAASLRELPEKAPLDIQFMSRADFVSAVLAPYDDAKMRDTLEAASAVGALDPNVDLKSIWTALASEANIVSMFDAQAKRMLVVETAPSQACALQHEAVHGLQMQHFGLGSLLAGPGLTDDARDAILMLAEADANSVPCDRELAAREDAQDNASAPAAQLDATPATPSLPSFVLLAVQGQQRGAAFVQALLEAGGHPKLDEAWRSPPKSTAQMLHPERYSAGQMPENVPESNPPTVGSGWTIHGSTTWGELRLENVLVSGETAADPSAAASWTGDQLMLYRKGDGVALAWRMRFSDPNGDHAPAKLARQAWVNHLGNGRGTSVVNGFECADDPRFGPRVVGRRGNDVLVLVGPYEVSGSKRRTLSSCAGAANWGVRVFLQKPA